MHNALRQCFTTISRFHKAAQHIFQMSCLGVQGGRDGGTDISIHLDRGSLALKLNLS